MKEKNIKVIFDTNVWVSFLNGKSFSILKQYIMEGNIRIIMSEQLFNELSQVTGRELKLYFPKNVTGQTIRCLQIIHFSKNGLCNTVGIKIYQNPKFSTRQL